MSKKLSLLISVIILSFTLTYFIFAFTDAPGPPPSCPSGYPGCDAPINVGPTAQTKSGALTVQGHFTAGGLTVGDNHTASIGCADFKIGYSERRGSPGRAIVDLGSDLRFNYGGDWPKASIGSSLDVHGNLRVNGNSNTCHLVYYGSSGTTYCPAGTYVAFDAKGRTATGYMLCCKVDNPL